MGADRSTGGTRSSTTKTLVLAGLAKLALVVVAGGGLWTVTCPCDTVPGFVLLGDTANDPVTNWGFANDVSLCQIQVSVPIRR